MLEICPEVPEQYGFQNVGPKICVTLNPALVRIVLTVDGICKGSKSL